MNSKEVLLVEDDLTTSKLVSFLLKKCGYTVVSCKNGDEAKRAFDERGHLFRFILTDGYYPGGDSREFIGHVRAKDDKIPILLMSGSLGTWFDENRNTIDFSRLIITSTPVSPVQFQKLFRLVDKLPPYRPKRRFSPSAGKKTLFRDKSPGMSA